MKFSYTGAKYPPKDAWYLLGDRFRGPDYLLWKCSADPDWIEVFPGIEPEQYECTCPGNRRKLRFGYSAEVGCCIDLNKIEYTPP